MGHIAFIDGGKVATAILDGPIAKGMAPEQITVADPGAGQRARLQMGYGVRVTDDLRAGYSEADTVTVAVKPQVIAQVAEQLARARTHCRDRAVELGKD